ncbi:Pirin-like protein CC_3178 [Pseudomonas sp. 8Z]|uniref:pirin family protein n=1 Tax=Pseudomonas sp. 8Z TaxID=2653166 RepID=UPI0012F2DC1F|nr:pirin family protein [Pseudomonas sp. 8Z]VXD01788.1 Pirin-like protein CC_3178 [Pseudomonas sp. 8Z]
MSELQLIRARAEDIVGQPILRPLPSARFRSIGPFVFFDHMLAQAYPAGSGMDIAQHPHIGLSTLTYLFEGQLQHKDSLGSDQLVAPGDVSWMTAGRGVAHVERTPPEQWTQDKRLHGLQVWLALPQAEEGCEPAYSHHPAHTLPSSETMGVRITLIAGSGFCLQSPVPVRSPTLYADLQLAAGASLLIPAEYSERALYLIEGEAELDGEPLPAQAMAVIPAGETPLLSACGGCRLALIGGEPIGPRRMNWNFVASTPELIDQARQRWAVGDWPHVAGETTRIELPR